MNNKQSKIWFTSDFHLDHKKIIEYSNRPFGSVAEMNDVILDNLNSRVNVDHTLYFLGDFALPVGTEDQKLNRVNELIKAIRCKNIVWIRGNHDYHYSYKANHGPHYSLPADLTELRLSRDEMYVLCHYPIMQWHKKRYGAFHLYGHCHGTLRPYDVNAMDVGIDTNKYCPYNLDDIRDMMTNSKLMQI